MKIEQLYTKCLAQGAYYIESEGEVAIIDPLRETDPYMQMAEENKATIKYIFETHFHADFVSGHIDLAKKTGATIVFGPTAKTGFEAHIATDGEEFKIGKLTLKVLHTPGHTLESVTYLLKDENGKEQAIFSGDTLFIGDVGRPDLAVKSDLSEKDLAGMLYDSLRNKIMPLPDHVIVYPAHGAGSACGKNIGSETFDTLGNQKKVNYALQDMTKEAFIEQLVDGILPPPTYFPINAKLNKMGYGSADEAIEEGTTALSLNTFKEHVSKGAFILDTRNPQTFAKGFIPNAVNIGIDGDFAIWLATIEPNLQRPIVFIADAGREEEVAVRATRVGHDYVLGFLEGGFEAWQAAGEKVDTIQSIDAEAFAQNVDKYTILDVRKPTEFESERVEGATSFPLDFIHKNIDTLDKNEPYYVHCAGGYRSMIASSILKANGYDNLVEVAGGMGAIKETKVPLIAYVCPTT